MAFTRVATIAPVHAASGAPTISLSTIVGSIQAGDVIVAGTSFRGTTNITAAPDVTRTTGGNVAMTLIGASASAGNATQNAAASSTGYNFALYQVTATDVSNGLLTVTWPTAAANAYSACLSVYRPTSASNVVTADVSTHRRITTAAASVTTAAGITTTVANTLLVAFGFGAIGSSAAWSAFDAVTDPTTASGATDTTNQPDGNWRERADGATTLGADASIAMADAIKASAGATGVVSATISGTAGLSAIGVVALREDAPWLGPTYVAVGTAADDPDTGSAPSVDYFAGLAADDIAYIFVCASVAISVPAGWSDEPELVNSNNRSRLLWKRLVGSESGSVTLSIASGGTAWARMFGVRGATTSGTPHEGYATASGSSTSAQAPATTTTGADRLGLRLVSNFVGQSTPPAGWTERIDDSLGISSARAFSLDTKNIPSATTEAASTRTITSSLWGAHSLAVIPAGGAVVSSLLLPPSSMMHMMMR